MEASYAKRTARESLNGFAIDSDSDLVDVALGVDFNLPAEPRFSIGPRLSLAVEHLTLAAGRPFDSIGTQRRNFYGFAGARGSLIIGLQPWLVGIGAGVGLAL